MPTLLDLPIKRCRPSEDVVPFSECRQNFSSYINRPRETHRPILITQNGRATSYLVDATDFDALMDSIELSRDVEISRREFAEGKGIPNDVVFDRLHKKLMAMKQSDAHARPASALNGVPAAQSSSPSPYFQASS